jgi:hypothetical protein
MLEISGVFSHAEAVVVLFKQRLPVIYYLALKSSEKELLRAFFCGFSKLFEDFDGFKIIKSQATSGLFLNKEGFSSLNEATDLSYGLFFVVEWKVQSEFSETDLKLLELGGPIMSYNASFAHPS